jgi:hypothetical protein
MWTLLAITTLLPKLLLSWFLLRRMRLYSIFPIAPKVIPTTQIRKTILLVLTYWCEDWFPLRKLKREILVSPLWVNVLVVKEIKELILIFIIWQLETNRNVFTDSSGVSVIPGWPPVSSNIESVTASTLMSTPSPVPMWEEIICASQIMLTATTHFLDSVPSFLNSALQLVNCNSVDNQNGRLVEDSGPGRTMRLEVEVPLLDGEGE